jgi:hypothetical protein
VAVIWLLPGVWHCVLELLSVVQVGPSFSANAIGAKAIDPAAAAAKSAGAIQLFVMDISM